MKKCHIFLLCTALLGGCCMTVWLWPRRTQPIAIAAEAKPPAARKVPAISLSASSPVYILTEPSATAPVRKLLSVIRALPPMLTTPEQSALIAVLRGGLKNMALSPGDRYHVANDLMLALRTRREPATGLFRVLCEIAGDNGMDPVIRDYALQHLGSAIANGPPQNDSRQFSLETLFTAAGNTQWSSCGTALLALMQVRDSGGEFPTNRLAAASEAAVLAPATDQAALTSAMLVCAGVRDVATVNPVLRQRLRQLAGDVARAPAVRASALAALGRLGEAADLPLFDSLLTDNRLGEAARAASAIVKDRATAAPNSF